MFSNLFQPPSTLHLHHSFQTHLWQTWPTPALSPTLHPSKLCTLRLLHLVAPTISLALLVCVYTEPKVLALREQVETCILTLWRLLMPRTSRSQEMFSGDNGAFCELSNLS